jgi:hypothetical protein
MTHIADDHPTRPHDAPPHRAHRRRRPIHRLVAAKLGTFAGVLALLTACSPPAPGRPGVSTDALAAFGHVHGFGVDTTSGRLFAAAHEGLFEIGTFRDGGFQVADIAGRGAIAGRAQDTMGFEMHEHRMFASGHPDPREDLALATPNLGLIVSDDSGETWAPVSLHGEVDFHDIAVAPDGEEGMRVYGYDAGAGTVMVSDDDGASWTTGAQIPIRDLTIDPEDSDTVFATTPDALVISTDAGATFSALPDAPALLLVEATSNGVIGIAVDGTVWVRDAGGAWRSTGAVDGDVEAMTWAARPQPLLVVLDARGIRWSADDGETWEDILPRR